MIIPISLNNKDSLDSHVEKESKVSLLFLFLTYLKIGSLAFGGYMALISVIENVIVKKLKLITEKDMLDGISLANLLPGPMAVNVVAFTGYKIRGYLGAIITTSAVIIPSFILILCLSYIYFNYGEIINLSAIFQGFMPAVAAVIFSVAWRLGKKVISGSTELIIAATAMIALLFIPIEYKIYTPLALIIMSGVIGCYIFDNHKKIISTRNNGHIFTYKNIIIILAFLCFIFVVWFAPLPLEKNSVLYLTLTFASMSLMLFGGGYVFIPVIGSVVVLKNGWLNTQEFNDGIALGQVTPGPILISATFIGYKVAGFWGAFCSTVAIFSIPAVIMVIVSRWFNFISQSSSIQAIMHGIHCSVIGMIFVAALIIFNSTVSSFAIPEVLDNFLVILIFISSLVGLIKFNLDVIWIIPPAGLIGYLLF